MNDDDGRNGLIVNGDSGERINTMMMMVVVAMVMPMGENLKKMEEPKWNKMKHRRTDGRAEFEEKTLGAINSSNCGGNFRCRWSRDSRCRFRIASRDRIGPSSIHPHLLNPKSS